MFNKPTSFFFVHNFCSYFCALIVRRTLLLFLSLFARKAARACCCKDTRPCSYASPPRISPFQRMCNTPCQKGRRDTYSAQNYSTSQRSFNGLFLCIKHSLCYLSFQTLMQCSYY